MFSTSLTASSGAHRPFRMSPSPGSFLIPRLRCREERRKLASTSKTFVPCCAMTVAQFTAVNVLPSDGDALVTTNTLAWLPAPSSRELRIVRYDSAALQYGCCCVITLHSCSFSTTCGQRSQSLAEPFIHGIVASDGNSHSASASSPERMVVSIASSTTALRVPSNIPAPSPIPSTNGTRGSTGSDGTWATSTTPILAEASPAEIP